MGAAPARAGTVVPAGLNIIWTSTSQYQRITLTALREGVKRDRASSHRASSKKITPDVSVKNTTTC